MVFAHLLNKPVLALSHHSKIATLMNDIGFSEFCVDIDSFDLDSLLNKFLLLTVNVEPVKTRMAETLARYRRELADQFDDLFPREFKNCLSTEVLKREPQRFHRQSSIRRFMQIRINALRCKLLDA